jgi:hypothetical protein
MITHKKVYRKIADKVPTLRDMRNKASLIRAARGPTISF